MTNNITVNKYDDDDKLARDLAEKIITKLADVLQQKDETNFVLTGGRLGITPLTAIAQSPNKDKVDWSKVNFWWGDERFAAEDDPDRNAKQAKDALLSKINVDPNRIHEVASSDKIALLNEASDDYTRQLLEAGKTQKNTSSDSQYPLDRIPEFDLTMLGIGPDAHIASLFPGLDGVKVTDALTIPVDNSPKPPPERVSLTLPVINASDEIWFVAGGAGKADAVKKAFTEGDDFPHAPAAGAKGKNKTVWFVDNEAASEIPEEFLNS